MRCILDEDVPIGLKRLLPGHEVKTTLEMGWAGYFNGRLIAAAEEAGFEALITGDQNLAYQQNLHGRRLAMIVLSETHWPTLRANPKLIREAVDRAGEGAFIEVAITRRQLRRRPPPSQEPR